MLKNTPLVLRAGIGGRAKSHCGGRVLRKGSAEGFGGRAWRKRACGSGHLLLRCVAEGFGGRVWRKSLAEEFGGRCLYRLRLVMGFLSTLKCNKPYSPNHDVSQFCCLLMLRAKVRFECDSAKLLVIMELPICTDKLPTFREGFSL